MKLFLKRNVSVEGCQFTVYDELGKEKYFVSLKGRNTPSRINLRVLDADGKIVAKSRSLPIVGTNTYLLSANKKRITLALVKSAEGFRCYFYGSNWHIHGEVFTKNFTINDVDNSVIMIHRRFADYSELEIYDETNELHCVCASVCINMINTVDKLTAQAV